MNQSEQQQKAYEHFLLMMEDVRNEGISDDNILRGLSQALGVLLWIEIQDGNEQIINDVEKIIKGEVENG